MSLETRIEALERHAKASDDIHKELLEKLHNKDVSDAVIRAQLDTLVKTTNRIDEKLDQQHQQIEQQEKDALAKPAKRWESVVSTIITTVVSAIAGALIMLLIKN